MNEEFESLFKQLGATVHGVMLADTRHGELELARLRVRYNSHGGWMSELRAVKVDGGEVPVSITHEIDLLIVSLGSQRQAVGREWWGFVFSVSRDQKCRIDLDYERKD